MGYSLEERSLSNPLSISSEKKLIPKTTSSKKVYGFVPYWLGSKATFQPELTDWAYFSLTIDSDGTLVKTKTPDYAFFNKSFSTLYQDAQSKNIKTDITFAQFEKEKVLAFLSSTTAQRQFFIELESIMNQYSIQGINIDFEVTGDVTDEQRTQFTEFIKRTNIWLDGHDKNLTLAIDVYPSSIERTTLWDIPALHEPVDYIVVMTYDFHRASSNNAGPISPLLNTGTKEKEKNITYYLAKFVKVVPKEKILLGIPFYGYEWETTDPFPRSFTLPRTGSTASIERINTLLLDSSSIIQHFWEDDTLSPFLYVQKEDKHFMISYENAQSLKYKLDLVQQLDIGGIAIWALGYEGESRELWNVIRDEL